MKQRTRKRISRLVPAIGVALAALALNVSTGGSAQAADDCIAKPNSTAPKGSHWFYRLDRAKHRQCWYIAAEGSHAHRSAVTKPSRAATRNAPPKPESIDEDEGLAPAPAPARAPALASAASAPALPMRESTSLDFSGRWPGPPRQVTANVAAPAPVGTAGSENAAPDAQEALSATSSAPASATPDTSQNTRPETAPRSAVEVRTVAIKADQAQLSTRPGALLALLAGALAVAALVMHVLLNRAAKRPPLRAQRPIWDTPDPWRRTRRDIAEPAQQPAHTPAAERPAAPARQSASMAAPPLAPALETSDRERSHGEPSDRDPVERIEQKLQQLLDGWRSRAA